MSPPSESYSSPSKKKMKKNKNKSLDGNSRVLESMIKKAEFDNLSEEITPSKKRKLDDVENRHIFSPTKYQKIKNNINFDENNLESELESPKKKKKKKRRDNLAENGSKDTDDNSLHPEFQAQEQLQDKHEFQMPDVWHSKYSKKKKKKRESSVLHLEENCVTSSENATSSETKKKINNSLSSNDESSSSMTLSTEPISPVKKKKKRKDKSLVNTESVSEFNYSDTELMSPGKKKKKKNKPMLENEGDNGKEANMTESDKTLHDSNKESMYDSEVQAEKGGKEEQLEFQVPVKKKKKKKKSMLEPEGGDDEASSNMATCDNNHKENIGDSEVPAEEKEHEFQIPELMHEWHSKSAKKQKEAHPIEENGFSENSTESENLTSTPKKKKKDKDKSLITITESDVESNVSSSESMSTSKKKKKKKKNKDKSIMETEDSNVKETSENDPDFSDFWENEGSPIQKIVAEDELFSDNTEPAAAEKVGNLPTIKTEVVSPTKKKNRKNHLEDKITENISLPSSSQNKEIIPSSPSKQNVPSSPSKQTTPNSPSKRHTQKDSQLTENTSEINKAPEIETCTVKHKHGSDKKITESNNEDSSECSLSDDIELGTKSTNSKKKRSYSYFLDNSSSGVQSGSRNDSESSLTLESSTSMSNEDKQEAEVVQSENNEAEVNSDHDSEDISSGSKSINIKCTPNLEYMVHDSDSSSDDYIEDDNMRKKSEPEYLLEKMMMRMNGFRIVRNFPVHEEHTFELSVSLKTPDPSVRESLENCDMLLKTRFTPEEDATIKQNWKNFCKIYFFDEDEAYMFTKQQVNRRVVMPASEYIVFAQFLGQGLPKRPLKSIYQRFVRIYLRDTLKTGQFTKKEDATILEFMAQSNSKTKYQELSEMLQRPRQSVYSRYNWLRNGESVNALKPIIMDARELTSYLKRIMKANGCKTVQQLKKTDVSWAALRRKYGAREANLCRNLWVNYLYNCLHLTHPLEIYNIERRIIKILVKSKSIQFQEQINWKELSEKHFPNIHPSKLSLIFHALKSRCKITRTVNLEDMLRKLQARHKSAMRTTQVLRPLPVLPDGTIESVEVLESELSHLDIVSDTETSSIASSAALDTSV